MKKVKIFAVAIIALVASTSVKAQEFSVNADIVSSYVWRGVQYSGASIQPTLQFTHGAQQDLMVFLKWTYMQNTLSILV